MNGTEHLVQVEAYLRVSAILDTKLKVTVVGTKGRSWCEFCS